MNIQHYSNSHNYEDIIIRKFSNDVCLEDILDSWKKLIENNLITEKTIGILNDLSECKLCLNKDNFKKLICYLKSVDIIKCKKLAVVCDNPKYIIFPMMAENNETELKIKAFSTIEAATEWIKNN